jgi:DNA-binding XRE family transcriptional regulator
MRYPNNLRVHREARQLTQWGVAKGVDIPLDRYERLERGRTEPSYDEGRRLGLFFGVDADALFPAPLARSA